MVEAVLAVALVAVVVLAGVAVVGLRQSRSGRRTRADSRVVSSKEVTADDGYYAPAYSNFPGRCFRLCREPETGTAYPCDQPVVGVGEFEDPRGNVVTVEACRDHQGTLTRWCDYSGSSDDPAAGGIAGVRAIAEDPGRQV
jgi:hypothetical protein